MIVQISFRFFNKNLIRIGMLNNLYVISTYSKENDRYDNIKEEYAFQQ